MIGTCWLGPFAGLIFSRENFFYYPQTEWVQLSFQQSVFEGADTDYLGAFSPENRLQKGRTQTTEGRSHYLSSLNYVAKAVIRHLLLYLGSNQTQRNDFGYQKNEQKISYKMSLSSSKNLSDAKKKYGQNNDFGIIPLISLRSRSFCSYGSTTLPLNKVGPFKRQLRGEGLAEAMFDTIRQKMAKKKLWP